MELWKVAILTLAIVLTIHILLVKRKDQPSFKQYNEKDLHTGSVKRVTEMLDLESLKDDLKTLPDSKDLEELEVFKNGKIYKVGYYFKENFLMLKVD